MEENLSAQKCDACDKNAHKLSENEIKQLINHLDNWEYMERNGIERLEKTYKVSDFSKALQYANKIGEIAEKEGHHPVLLVAPWKITIKWWTHIIGGLHKNDFIMARKTDDLMKDVNR